MYRNGLKPLVLGLSSVYCDIVIILELLMDLNGHLPINDG